LNLTLNNARHPLRALGAFFLMLRTIDNPRVFLSDCLALAHGDVVYRIKNGPMLIHARAGTPDFYEILIVLGNREYDLSLVDANVSNHPIILDIGGHIGTFTLLALQRYVDRMPTIVVLEPAVDNYEYLTRNLEANAGLTRAATIHTVNAALGAADGSAVLDRDRPSDSYQLRTELGVGGRQLQECKVMSIQTLCSQLSIEHVDILKMDIEGSEHDVFRDPKTRAFVDDNVDFIFVEVHDVAPDRGSRTLMCLLGDSFDTISGHDRVVVLRNRAVASKVA
jgi:FkbM family methyltransferase